MSMPQSAVRPWPRCWLSGARSWRRRLAALVRSQRRQHDLRERPAGKLRAVRRTRKAAVSTWRRPGVKWVARLGSNAYGNPTVAGGHVYVD